jgi:16S rRNA (adenine1518-N6/adenine1519-N6)-dimethyltransferase
MSETKLGQHWLFDQTSLKSVAAAGKITSQDIVLEIGPGHGSLTEVLLQKAKSVVAVEIDEELYINLTQKLTDEKLSLINQDILGFDLSTLNSGYKVVANIPYYITAKSIHKLVTAHNPPSLVCLLVQKEVAQRLAANPGQLSVLGVSAQLYAKVKLHEVILAKMFQPPPKVDSQIVSLELRSEPLFDVENEKLIGLVKAGFSNRRKKLINSLSGVYDLDKESYSNILRNLGIDDNVRAQELSLQQWYELYNQIRKYV